MFRVLSKPLLVTITNNLADDDTARIMKNMFVRTNTLFRRFRGCSFKVKVLIFKSYVVCLYDAALWKMYKLLHCPSYAHVIANA